MKSLKQPINERPLHPYAMRLAVVEARPWESNEEAWHRHLIMCPQDSQANVKIFNRGRAARTKG